MKYIRMQLIQVSPRHSFMICDTGKRIKMNQKIIEYLKIIISGDLHGYFFGAQFCMVPFLEPRS